MDDFDTTRWCDAIIASLKKNHISKEQALKNIKALGFDATENAQNVCLLYKK
jgi:hypothetical protein